MARTVEHEAAVAIRARRLNGIRFTSADATIMRALCCNALVDRALSRVGLPRELRLRAAVTRGATVNRAGVRHGPRAARAPAVRPRKPRSWGSLMEVRGRHRGMSFTGCL